MNNTEKLLKKANFSSKLPPVNDTLQVNDIDKSFEKMRVVKANYNFKNINHFDLRAIRE